MRLVPIGDKIAVKRLRAKKSTVGGIVLPDSAQEKPKQGKVLSVGDGRRMADGSHAPHQVNEGDRVLFSAYAGTEIVVDDEEILIMSEDEVLAVIE